jgi:hypothetical protein
MTRPQLRVGPKLMACYYFRVAYSFLRTLSLWPAILEMAHTMGHEVGEKMLHHLRATFYSPQASRRVREFVRSCVVCQQNKIEHLHPGGLLRPLPVS